MNYRFDRFELDTEHRVLTADGAPLDADSRAVQLLALLIEAWPGHAERRLLLERIWPTTVVAHWSLARLVSDTRKLFANAGYTGPLIQTVHGRGYRLAPELATALGLSRPGNAEEAVPGASARPYRPGLIALLAVVAALSVVGTFTTWRTAERDTLTIGEATDVVGRVLWVDDHPENNLEERRFLESQRIAVYTVTSTDDALKLLAMYRGRYGAVISDMGRGNDPLAGLKLVGAMREAGDETPFFMYTILVSNEKRRQVVDAGGQGVAETSTGLYELVLPQFPQRRAAD